LHRGRGIAAGHAHHACSAPDSTQSRAPRLARRMALRHELRSDSFRLAFAGAVLHGGPHTLGFLMGASGLGALISAALLASRKSVLGLGKVIPVSAVMFGAGLVAFGFSRMLWLCLLVLLFAGDCMTQQMAASNTMLQTIVDDDKRGRVMSFCSMAFLGMTPFGSLLEGALASRIGAPHTLMIGGL